MVHTSFNESLLQLAPLCRALHDPCMQHALTYLSLPLQGYRLSYYADTGIGHLYNACEPSIEEQRYALHCVCSPKGQRIFTPIPYLVCESSCRNVY